MLYENTFVDQAFVCTRRTRTTTTRLGLSGRGVGGDFWFESWEVREIQGSRNRDSTV